MTPVTGVHDLYITVVAAGSYPVTSLNWINFQ